MVEIVVLLPPFHHFHHFYHFQRSTCCFLRKRSNGLGTMFQQLRNNILRPEKYCVLLPFFYDHRFNPNRSLERISSYFLSFHAIAVFLLASCWHSLCNSMNNAQPISVSSVPSVVKNTCEYHFNGKKCRFLSLFRHFFVVFLSLFVAFLSIFRHFCHISTTSTTISTTIK